MGRSMGRYAPLLVRVSSVIALGGQFNADFRDARPFVHDVMDCIALFRADSWEDSWDAAWYDLFDCWCGCPL